ncbi:MAG: DNA cytosine methyltransferase [Cocleimonas sp.]
MCSGFGGLELGLLIAQPNYKTVCYVEREAAAAATLVARMGDQTMDCAPIWDDVKTFDGRRWRDKVHIVTGGYPCQPFSQAGHQRGEKDPRHLWPYIETIVQDVQPDAVFFENVKGHLNVGFSKVAKSLQRMGVKVKAGVFSAAEVGASHFRDRLFILGYTNRVHSWERNGILAGRWEDEVSFRQRPKCETILSKRSSPIVDLHGGIFEGVWSMGQTTSQKHPLIYAPDPDYFSQWQEILNLDPTFEPSVSRTSDG